MAANPILETIISGGQTGVDRGGLDAAIARGIPHGGWCPEGRLAEDGRIPDRYEVTENGSRDYAVRTEQNVLVSDGTLVLCIGKPSGGTALTCYFAEQHRKPLLVVDLARDQDPHVVTDWLATHSIRVMNVAGPRESTHPGIQLASANFIVRVLDSRTANDAL